MSHSAKEIAQALRKLQAAATSCANSFTTSKLKVEYRVAYSAGAAVPWRLLEIHFRIPRNNQGHALRRMHWFSTSDCLSRSLQERAKWKACDQQLVASYLVKVRSTSESYIESELNPQAAGSLRSSVDLSELRPARLELRAQMCVTRPARVVDLMSG